jgi:hypothetical protein
LIQYVRIFFFFAVDYLLNQSLQTKFNQGKYLNDLKFLCFKTCSALVCYGHFLQCIFTVSSPAHDQQVHLALVWRESSSLDNSYAIFSMRFVRRLCLCARTHANTFTSVAGWNSYRLAIAWRLAG